MWHWTTGGRRLFDSQRSTRTGTSLSQLHRVTLLLHGTLQRPSGKRPRSSAAALCICIRRKCPIAKDADVNRRVKLRVPWTHRICSVWQQSITQNAQERTEKCMFFSATCNHCQPLSLSCDFGSVYKWQNLLTNLHLGYSLITEKRLKPGLLILRKTASLYFG